MQQLRRCFALHSRWLSLRILARRVRPADTQQLCRCLQGSGPAAGLQSQHTNLLQMTCKVSMEILHAASKTSRV